LDAQRNISATDLRVGDRVRVRVGSPTMETHQGTLRLITRDSLRIRRDADSLDATIPVFAIQRIDLSVGNVSRGDRVRQSVIIGTGVGLIAGLGLSVARACGEAELLDNGDARRQCRPNADDAAKVALLGAAAGATIGFFVGLVRPTDDWRRLPLPLELTMGHDRERWRGGIRLSFGGP
jgi:hypothetical protein